MFLYILSIPKYKAIKIGIANSFNRVKQHNNTYEGIDYKESYIVHAKSQDTIKMLEKQLLQDYIEYKVNNKELMKRDGYTECRKETMLQDILDDISFKAMRFESKEIKIIKGIDIENKHSKDEKVDKKESPSIEILDVDNHRSSNKMIVIEKQEKPKIIKEQELYMSHDVIPKFLLEFPMFYTFKGGVSEVEYNINDIKIKVDNNNGKVINLFDLEIIIKALNLYIKSQNINNIDELKYDNWTEFTYKEFLRYLGYASFGALVTNMVKASLERLNNTTINIYKNNKLLYKDVRLISTDFDLRNNVKKLIVNRILIDNILNEEYILIKNNATTDIKCDIAIKLYMLIQFMKEKDKALNFEFDDMYNMLSLIDDKSVYYKKRRCLDALNELLEKNLINKYEKNKTSFIIY